MLTCEQGGTSSSEFAVKQNAQQTWTNKTKPKISQLWTKVLNLIFINKFMFK